MVGSIENIYESFKTLSDGYLQPNISRDILLNPNSPIISSDVPHLFSSKISHPKKFYMCTKCNHSTTADSQIESCPSCKTWYSNVSAYRSPVKAFSTSDESGGFVRGAATYMVMDDLKVLPHSTSSTIKLLNDYNIKDIGCLEMKDFPFGADVGLKASLHTQSVLTSLH